MKLSINLKKNQMKKKNPMKKTSLLKNDQSFSCVYYFITLKVL